MIENINKKIRFRYDSEVDVLYASIGAPKPAACIEKDNGTVIRVDPKTGNVVGFTIVKYMARIKRGLLTSIPEFENIKLPQY